MPGSSVASASTVAGQEQDEPELRAELAMSGGDGFTFDAERIVARVQGREGWMREARRQLEQRPLGTRPTGAPGTRARLLHAARRLEDELAAKRAANRL